MLFSAADAGIVWADAGLDLTAEVIKRFDARHARPSAQAARRQPRRSGRSAPARRRRASAF